MHIEHVTRRMAKFVGEVSVVYSSHSQPLLVVLVTIAFILHSHSLAAFSDADPSDLVLVPNASTGTSSVIQSLADTFKPGEAIFTLNVAYGTFISALYSIWALWFWGKVDTCFVYYHIHNSSLEGATELKFVPF